MAAGDWRQRHESELPDHYEKRLQNEEAAVLTRMRHRALFSRRGVQNLIVLSILGEVWQFASLCVTSVKSDARMEAPTLLPLLLLLAVKMGRFFESVGNFFTGGDNIPWCDRNIIAVSTRELPPLSASI